MQSLTQVELNIIREILNDQQVMAVKFNCYANQCHDAVLKDMFSKSAKASVSLLNELLLMLG